MRDKNKQGIRNERNTTYYENNAIRGVVNDSVTVTSTSKPFPGNPVKHPPKDE